MQTRTSSTPPEQPNEPSNEHSLYSRLIGHVRAALARQRGARGHWLEMGRPAWADDAEAVRLLCAYVERLEARVRRLERDQRPSRAPKASVQPPTAGQ